MCMCTFIATSTQYIQSCKRVCGTCVCARFWLSALVCRVVGCNVAVEMFKYCAQSMLINTTWLLERRPIVHTQCHSQYTVAIANTAGPGPRSFNPFYSLSVH